MTPKDTNPKDAIGEGKLPLELIPDSMLAETSLAFLEGALKYGRFNWRMAGVRNSIYIAAARRHIAKYWNGEDHDPTTQVHHLASAIAGLGIILDAELSKMLTDDRPPSQRHLSLHIDNLAAGVSTLKKIFADQDPYQYSIKDRP